MSQDNSKEKSNKIKASPRAIALIGPHGGGKTSLLESIASITGAIPRNSSSRFGERIQFFTTSPAVTRILTGSRSGASRE